MEKKRLQCCAVLGVWMFFLLPLSAKGQIKLPEEGLTALWSFSKGKARDLIGNKELLYKGYAKFHSWDACFDTLSNGSVAFDSRCALPFKLMDLSDSVTVVLRYHVLRSKSRISIATGDGGMKPLWEDYDMDVVDGKLLSVGRFVDVLEADDGMLLQEGCIDSAYTTRLEYEIPMTCDGEGAFCLIYTMVAMHQFPLNTLNSANAFRYARGITVGDKQYWILKSSPSLNTSDYILVDVPPLAWLTDIALYNRTLTPEEQAGIMGVDKIQVMEPGMDYTSWDWRWPLPVAFILLVVMRGVRLQLRRYKPIGRQFVINRYPLIVEDARKKALGHIGESWKAFGSSDKPLYPQSAAQLLTARKELDAALATGCADEDVLAEYNRLAALINHCRSFTYGNPWAVFMATMLLLLAAIDPFLDKNLMYMIYTDGFGIYFLSAAAIVMCAFSERYLSHGGEPIKNASKIMSAMEKAASALTGVVGAVGVTVAGALSALLGMVVIFFKVVLGCIFEFVIVAVPSMTVVATGFAGLGAGLFIGFGVALLLGWLIHWLYLVVLWWLVIILPIASFVMSGHFKMRKKPLEEKPFPFGNSSTKPPFHGMGAILLLLALSCCLVSCHPGERYEVRTDTMAGNGVDTLKAGDRFMLKKYFSDDNIRVKSELDGDTYCVNGGDLFNVETGKTLAEDMAVVDHEHLLYRIKQRDVPKEVHMQYRRYTVIAATVLLVFVVLLMIFIEKLSRNWMLVLYILLSFSLLATNYFYLQYTVTLHGHGRGFWSYLFSPGNFGWLNTVFFWVAYFLLSAANLFGYISVAYLSQEWSGRCLFNRHVFLAMLVWFVVYLFSPNEMNGRFLQALYIIMGLHFIALLVENFIRKANVLEMLYIYFCFWGCMLPVFLTTVNCLVLVPLLLLLFASAKAAPGLLKDMVRGVLSNNSSGERIGSRERFKVKVSDNQKACVFCRWYEESSGTCSYLGAGGKRESYGADAYSCSGYS